MTDIAGITPSAAPTTTLCLDCEATGSRWFHLRRCAQCGQIGCCDDSPSGHARSHYTETGHPIIQSFEPGEDWFWSYPGETYLRGPALAEPTSHPDEQPVPGPASRVPANWRQLIGRQP